MHDLGVLDWAERAMADGRIGHLGFSVHDKYEVFQEIVDAYDGWTFCQVQYNYMDEQEQAGVKGLKYAAGRELAVVVMEPLRGGLLAGNIPQPVQELWDSAAPPAVAGLPTKPLPAVAGLPTKPLPAVAGLLTEPLPAVAGLPTEPLPAVAGLPTEPQRNTPADRALQWVWNQPEVSLLLSGMSTMQQVVENVASAGRSAPGSLTAADLALIARVRDKYRELAPIPCTNCKYCQPCPNGVSIPRVFEAYNEAIMYNNASHARLVYSQWFSPEERADRCLRCGECEAACPQQIPIMEWLEKAHQFLIATLPTTARS
jgi:predicted aldo/keto reductase-like oxidoreductase